MDRRARGRIAVHSATDVPAALLDEVIEDMATRMSGSPEARSCVGLSFVFDVTDHPVRPARYAIARGGRVVLTRDDPAEASFHFSGRADVFDTVLRGHQNALGAVLRRRIHLSGSLSHLRQLLRMMPSVHRAYGASREALIERHAARYDFRF